MADTFNLQRFVEAQESVYEIVLEELKAGEKHSHWMWYIFPQVKGLGDSAMTQLYAISSRAEAKTYLEHPLLGERLKECTQAVLDVQNKSAAEIFHHPDDRKFRSSMTLYAEVAAEPSIFREALMKYFDGEPDHKTLNILGSQ